MRGNAACRARRCRRPCGVNRTTSAEGGRRGPEGDIRRAAEADMRRAQERGGRSGRLEIVPRLGRSQRSRPACLLPQWTRAVFPRTHGLRRRAGRRRQQECREHHRHPGGECGVGESATGALPYRGRSLCDAGSPSVPVPGDDPPGRQTDRTAEGTATADRHGESVVEVEVPQS
jgi:hypothetical protein